jgi:predicted nucleotidyltransferase
MSKTALNNILSELKRDIAGALGPRFEAAYLFGSRARGEAQPDSDIDVLVVVRGTFDYGDLVGRTSTFVTDLCLRHDVVISRVFVSKDRFEREQSPFLLNVRREGVLV